MAQENLDNLELLEQAIPDEDENEALVADMQAEEQAAEEDAAAQEAARAGAAMAVSFAETLVKMKWAYVEIDNSSREAVKEKTAAVLAKYGGGLPEWLQPYREEIELGMVLGGVGVGVWAQVQAHKAAGEQAEQEAAGHAAKAGQPEYKAQ